MSELGAFDLVIHCIGCAATTIVDETKPYQTVTADGWHRSGMTGTYTLCSACLAGGADRRFERSRYCLTCGTFRVYADFLPEMPDGKGPDTEISSCVDCLPKKCERCGEMDSYRESCSCWISLEDMPMADIKALFARDGGFDLKHEIS